MRIGLTETAKKRAANSRHRLRMDHFRGRLIFYGQNRYYQRICLQKSGATKPDSHPRPMDELENNIVRTLSAPAVLIQLPGTDKWHYADLGREKF